jgi:hypothetical protein
VKNVNQMRGVLCPVFPPDTNDKRLYRSLSVVQPIPYLLVTKAFGEQPDDFFLYGWTDGSHIVRKISIFSFIAASNFTISKS